MRYLCGVFLGAGDLFPTVSLLLPGRAIWNSGGHLLLLLYILGIWPHLQLLSAAPPPPGPNWGRLSSAASGPQETPECLCPEELWECRWLRLQSSYSAIPDHPEPLSRKQMAGLGSPKCRGAPLRMAKWTHLNPQEWGGGDYYQGNSSF